MEVHLVLGVGNTAAAVVVEGSMRLGVVGAGIVVVGGMAEGDRMSSRLDRRHMFPEEDRMGVGPKRGVNQNLEERKRRGNSRLWACHMVRPGHGCLDSPTL